MTKDITQFGGVTTAFNPKDIDANVASDALNARVEGGFLRPRWGYNNLASAQAGFTAILGFDYVHGYSGTTEKEEYLSVETVSGNTYPYSRNVTTGAATEILNSASHVSLNASEWVMTAFRASAYFINPSDTSSIWRHDIGDATSMTAVAIPTAPATAPTYTVTLGGGSTPYTQLSFQGIDPTSSGEVACTGAATNTGSALNSDNTLSIRHTDSEVESSFEVDLFDGNAGVQDWTYNDKFAFTLYCETGSFDIDMSSIKVQLSNNEGTPKVLTPTYCNAKVNPNPLAGYNGRSYVVEFGYDDKTRTDFDNVRYFKVSYKVRTASATVANNDLIVSKPYIGGIDMQVPPDRLPDVDGLRVGYTHYFSTPDFESGISPLLIIPNTNLRGYAPVSGLAELGVNIELTVTVSADSNVDKFRVYIQNVSSEKFHRIVTQADSDLTYDLRISYLEAIRLTEYQPTPFTFTSVTSAFPYKGCMIWLYDKGESNIAWSRVGDPLRQYSQEDPDDDLNRGATFTLADNFGDKPLGGCQVGDAVMIAGKLGVHYQLGDYPAQATPPRRVSGSFGVAGKYAFCRWKTDQGVPVMAYVATNGQIYAAAPGGTSDQNTGDTVSLTDSIREGSKSLKNWLLDEQSSLSLTDFSTAQLRVDPRDDCLVVIMGRRGLKLRRPDLRGQRTWEPVSYNTGGDTVTIRYMASATKYGIRWMRSSGKVDEDEYSNASRQYVGGINRDGGNPMPQGYWKSKSYTGQNRRIQRVFVDRERMNETVRVRVHSLRRTQVYKMGENRRFAMCLPDQQGFDHVFEVILTETDGYISRLSWDEVTTGRRFSL